MRVAERAGLVQRIARGLRPVMRRLFPDVPAEHPAMGSMLMNMAANMLGLGNAATPLGLRAMRDLKSLNPRPGVASNAMCTFLAINTSSVQLIPATAIAILAAAGSARPTVIVGTAFFATLCAATVAVLSAKFFERLSFFRPVATEGSKKKKKPKPQPAYSKSQSTDKFVGGLRFGIDWLRLRLFFLFRALSGHRPKERQSLEELSRKDRDRCRAKRCEKCSTDNHGWSRRSGRGQNRDRRGWNQLHRAGVDRQKS